jgi:hypothetical protein
MITYTSLLSQIAVTSPLTAALDFHAFYDKWKILIGDRPRRKCFYAKKNSSILYWSIYLFLHTTVYLLDLTQNTHARTHY